MVQLEGEKKIGNSPLIIPKYVKLHTGDCAEVEQELFVRRALNVPDRRLRSLIIFKHYTMMHNPSL